MQLTEREKWNDSKYFTQKNFWCLYACSEVSIDYHAFTPPFYFECKYWITQRNSLCELISSMNIYTRIWASQSRQGNVSIHIIYIIERMYLVLRLLQMRLTFRYESIKQYAFSSANYTLWAIGRPFCWCSQQQQLQFCSLKLCSVRAKITASSQKVKKNKSDVFVRCDYGANYRYYLFV